MFQTHRHYYYAACCQLIHWNHEEQTPLHSITGVCVQRMCVHDVWYARRTLFNGSRVKNACSNEISYSRQGFDDLQATFYEFNTINGPECQSWHRLPLDSHEKIFKFPHLHAMQCHSPLSFIRLPFGAHAHMCPAPWDIIICCRICGCIVW